MYRTSARVLGVVCAVLAHGAAAQNAGALRDPGQKIARIVRTSAPPVIDGVLDDAVWADAAVVTDLHQVNPIEYAAPSERTEIYLLYDDDALYVGARLYTDPDDITANVLRQNNAAMTQDDTLFVTLDPFNTRRGGYFFGVNPNGVRQDGLYRNVSEFYGDWDTIYEAKTSRFAGGWTAEYEIPFKSLSFDPNADTWGLNFSRTIQFRDEDIAWVTRNRRWDPSSAGLLVGLEGLEQGIGLDVVTSVSAAHTKRFETPAALLPIYVGPSSRSDAEPSLDLVYKLTPALNASLTINTDFSATEVDDRQVNLTRFGLFFPEKRDFFLREADIFEFGRIGASDGNGSISAAERQNGRPFFSRRIGLDAAGTVVDLEYGGKVSGRVGRFELGALSIRQDAIAGADPARPPAVLAQTLSVVRAKAGLGAESTVGAVLTNGDPLSNVDSSLAGVDFLYRNSRLPGGRILEAGAWYQETDTDGVTGADSAAGIGVSIPSNAGFRGGFALRELERNFYPALGFVSRRDVRDTSGHIGYTHRPVGGYWRSLYFVLDGQRIETLDGRLQSQRVSVTPFQLTNRTGDVLFMRSNFEKESLDAPFEISRGVTIPRGDYSFSDHGIEYGWATHRKLSGRIAVTEGDFFGGNRVRLFGNAAWQPSPRFRASLGYNINDIDLPQGSFHTRILSTGFDVVFSSTLSWVNLIQYDNVSEIMGVNMRLHWIPEAGREIFFVVNHNLEDVDRDNAFHSIASDVVAKLAYTFRF